MDNTWHALKVAFANEVGRVCLQLGLSASKVSEIFLSDTKLNISSYYMRPGGAFGGSVCPRMCVPFNILQLIAAPIRMLWIRSCARTRHTSIGFISMPRMA